MSNDKHRGVSLHTKILIALLLGAVLGSIVKWCNGENDPAWLSLSITYVFDPIGKIFLAMLFGFMIFDLMEAQKEQAARFRAMRRRFASENGFASDLEKITGDWQRVENDLKTGSQKVLSEI